MGGIFGDFLEAIVERDRDTSGHHISRNGPLKSPLGPGLHSNYWKLHFLRRTNAYVSPVVFLIAVFGILHLGLKPSTTQEWIHFVVLHGSLISLWIWAYRKGTQTDFIEIREEETREEQLRHLRANFNEENDLRRGPSSLQSRAYFAIYLADPSKSANFMIPGYSKRHLRGLLLVSWLLMCITCDALVISYSIPWVGIICRIVAGFWIVLLGPILAWIFWVVGRSSKLGIFAEKIREGCSRGYIEAGEGDLKIDRTMYLAWWIENLLKENGDSEDRAEERMKKVIMPIINIVDS